MSVNIIGQSIDTVNAMIAPIAPPGVTGVEFITVFLIIYAIIFLIMEKIKFLKDNRAARLLLALAIAYFTATSTFSTILITKMFPYLGIVTVVIVIFMLLTAFLSKSDEGIYSLPGWFRLLIIFAAIGAIMIMTWISIAGEINLGGIIPMPEISSVDWGSIIILGIFLFVIILIFMSGPRKEKAVGAGIGKKLGDFLKELGGNI